MTYAFSPLPTGACCQPKSVSLLYLLLRWLASLFSGALKSHMGLEEEGTEDGKVLNCQWVSKAGCALSESAGCLKATVL